MKMRKRTVLLRLACRVELCRAFGNPNDGDNKNHEYATTDGDNKNHEYATT